MLGFALIFVPEMAIEVVVEPTGTDAPVDTLPAEDIIEELDDTTEAVLELGVVLVVDNILVFVVEVLPEAEALASSEGKSSRSSRASVNSRMLKSSPMSRKSPSPIPRSPNSLLTLLSNPSRSSEETLGPSPAVIAEGFSCVDVVEVVETAPVVPCVTDC